MIPRADNNELLNNWDPRIPNQRFQQIPSVKIDHSFSERSKLSGYWSLEDTTQITGADGLPIPITGRRDQEIYGHTVRLNLDQSLSPTFLLHLGAGYLRFHNPDSAPDEVITYDAVGGIGFKGASTVPSGFPSIVGPGLGNLQGNRGGMSAMGPAQANKFWNDKLTAVANASWVRGNHSYKFGGEFKQEVWSDVNFTAAQGRVAFSEAQTALPYLQNTTVGGGSIGYRYASFLLGHGNHRHRLRNKADTVAQEGNQFLRSGFLEDHAQTDDVLRIALGLRRPGQRASSPREPDRTDDAEPICGRTAGRIHLRRRRGQERATAHSLIPTRMLLGHELASHINSIRRQCCVPVGASATASLATGGTSQAARRHLVSVSTRSISAIPRSDSRRSCSKMG